MTGRISKYPKLGAIVSWFARYVLTKASSPTKFQWYFIHYTKLTKRFILCFTNITESSRIDANLLFFSFHVSVSSKQQTFISNWYLSLEIVARKCRTCLQSCSSERSAFWTLYAPWIIHNPIKTIIPSTANGQSPWKPIIWKLWGNRR